MFTAAAASSATQTTGAPAENAPQGTAYDDDADADAENNENQESEPPTDDDDEGDLPEKPAVDSDEEING